MNCLIITIRYFFFTKSRVGRPHPNYFQRGKFRVGNAHPIYFQGGHMLTLPTQCRRPWPDYVVTPLVMW